MKKKIWLLVLAAVMALALSVGIIAATAENDAPEVSVEIVGHNLALEDSTYIIYYVDVDGSDVRPELWVWDSKPADLTDHTGAVKADYIETEYGYYKFYLTGIAAKQMTDNKYAVASVSDNGITYSEVDKYSVLAYAYTQKVDPNASWELKNVLSNLLNYGASAQSYFGYKNDYTANGDWARIDVVGGTLTDGMTYGMMKSGAPLVLIPDTSDGKQVDGWRTVNGSWYDVADAIAVKTSTTYTAGTYAQGLVYASNGDGTCKVTAIGTFAGSDLILPRTSPAGDKVTGIGASAFAGAANLQRVTLPEAIAEIGDLAFDGCTNLTRVDYNGTMAQWESITKGTEWESDPLDSAIVCTEQQLTQWITYTAKNGLQLKLNDTGSEMTVTGKGTATGDVVIPDQFYGYPVTGIGDNVFSNCSDLTSITIPSSVASIGESAFNGCSGLTGVYITDLAKWCKITFESADANPLYYDRNLYLNGKLATNLTIPSSVTSIGNYAFNGCSSITSVAIPSSVTSIDKWAFSSCSGLKSIAIPSTVTSIGDRAFYGCRDLTSVTIPSSVTSIGDHAFYYCSALTSVTIPSGVTSIEVSTFGGCSGLTSITIPSSVTSIGDSAFSDCSGLTSITIPSSVTSIGDSAFSDCSGLTSITIQEGVTNIGEWAFCGCSGLTSVTIPSSVTSISKRAFYDCSKLTSVTILEGVVSIGDRAFYNCSNLTSVTIPSSVTSIDYCAFYVCSGLTSITFQGTKVQWEAITKKSYWNDFTGNYTIHCTDGDLDKNGNVIQ